MKIQELEELATKGQLTVNKHHYRTYIRFKPWPSKETTTYTVYAYQARTPDMDESSFYRIRKQDYIKLDKIIKQQAYGQSKMD